MAKAFRLPPTQICAAPIVLSTVQVLTACSGFTGALDGSSHKRLRGNSDYVAAGHSTKAMQATSKSYAAGLNK
jgi:hypothetical protein